MVKKVLELIDNFMRQNWIWITTIMMVVCISFCLVAVYYGAFFLGILSAVGWSTALIISAILYREQQLNEIRVLQAKVEIAENYNDALEQGKEAIEFFTGYNEQMIESVEIYSQMSKRGVEAPVANSLIAFSNDLGLENTILLVNIDHLNKEWNVRVAGRPIYSSQLKAILKLVNMRLDEKAKPYGMVISEPTIDN